MKTMNPFYSRYKNVNAIQVNVCFTLGEHTWFRKWISLDPISRKGSKLLVEYLEKHYEEGTPDKIYQPGPHPVLKEYLRGGTERKQNQDRISVRFAISPDLHKKILTSSAAHELLIQEEILSAIFYGIDHEDYPIPR